eukprot:1083636-Prorocentrum_lima.AAC.1
MSHEYVALPLQMYVAVKLDVNNSGWTPSILKDIYWRAASRIQPGRLFDDRPPELLDVFWIEELD